MNGLCTLTSVGLKISPLTGRTSGRDCLVLLRIVVSCLRGNKAKSTNQLNKSTFSTTCRSRSGHGSETKVTRTIGELSPERVSFQSDGLLVLWIFYTEDLFEVLVFERQIEYGGGSRRFVPTFPRKKWDFVKNDAD